MKLYRLLKAYRKRHRLLQKQISSQFGISREHYARIESGNLIPSFQLLQKISTEIHVSIIIVLSTTHRVMSPARKGDSCQVRVVKMK